MMDVKVIGPANPTCHGAMAVTNLTKREYFAACALQGLLANGLLSEQIIHPIADIPTRIPKEFFGQAAVMYADGLIAELNKGV